MGDIFTLRRTSELMDGSSSQEQITDRWKRKKLDDLLVRQGGDETVSPGDQLRKRRNIWEIPWRDRGLGRGGWQKTKKG